MADSYWYSRLVFERALALVYLVAFLCAANQFIPLLGEHGLLPAPRFVQRVPFRRSPSLFYFAPTDIAFRAAAWLGVALSTIVALGMTESRGGIVHAAMWAALWLLYLSFVNVGWMFYAFGWETLLLETGFVTIFAGDPATQPSIWTIWLWRWILFRLMFGAGLSKLRGDPCWRRLSCLDYHFETQPIPNALSWYFHQLPPAVHRAGVLFNHVAELVAPLFFFAPQPYAAIAGVVTIAFQLVLVASGNLSWLNWLTIVLAVPLFDDRWFAWLPAATVTIAAPGMVQHALTLALVGLVAVLSVKPVLNLLSPNQVMIASFGALHLVNTYGAFAGVTSVRREVTIEGADEERLTPKTVWREYEFKGKPGPEARRQPQIAPYHLRLDWLMWFAALSLPAQQPWFAALLDKLLDGDRATLKLLRTNPFHERPPRFVRAVLHEYRFTTRDERRQTGRWWHREAIGLYAAPVSRPTRGSLVGEDRQRHPELGAAGL